MRAITAAASAGQQQLGADPAAAAGGVVITPARITLAPTRTPAIVQTSDDSAPTPMPSSDARSAFSAIARTATPDRV